MPTYKHTHAEYLHLDGPREYTVNPSCLIFILLIFLCHELSGPVSQTSGNLNLQLFFLLPSTSCLISHQVLTIYHSFLL
jgi:hypothetical protein